MERNVDVLILSAMNTCWRERITLPTLLTLLREQQSPADWLGPVSQLFAEVPAAAVQRWAMKHDLSPSLLGQYYDRFIRPWDDLNPELEAWIHGRLGTSL